MDLVCRSTVVGDIPTLTVRGEVDLASIPVLRDALVRIVTESTRRTQDVTVAVDLDGVTVLDDAGLGILLGAAARARQAGGDLVLVCTTPRLLAGFEVSGLARAIEVRDRLTP